MEETTEAAMSAADQVFGPACDQVPADGDGSFDGMATAPVASAASANPLLSTLVTAVTKAGLVDTLNSADGITVFAPVNDAFGPSRRRPSRPSSRTSRPSPRSSPTT